MNNIEQYMKTLFGYTFKDDDYNFIKKEFDKKDKEIDRLNNIIDELEKYILNYNIGFPYSEFIKKQYIIDKLKELKEDK